MSRIRHFIAKHAALIRQIALYGLIGGGSSLLDSALYVVLTHGLHINMFVSNFASVSTGILTSFLLNTYVNFRKTDRLGKRAISFFAIGYCGMGLSMLLLYIGTDVMGIQDIVVKLSSIFIVAAFQFVLNKLITFSKI